MHDLGQTVRDMIKLVLFTRKWHMAFGLLPNSVTINDLERRNYR